MFGRKGNTPAPREEVERALRDHGTAALAVVDDASSSTARGGSVRWQFKLTVKPVSGRSFRAEFVQDLPADATFSHPAHVLYDAEHHALVMIDPAHLGEDTRVRTVQIGAGGVVSGGGPQWAVPQHCPNCGAAVDQAVESMRADPLCHFCGQPLPVSQPPDR